MALTVQDIITPCENMLQDTANVRWSSSELIDYVNEAVNEILHYKPIEYVKTTAHTLVSGTRQTIPSDGVAIVDIVRNMGVDGATVGASPKAISMEALDISIPNWHESAAGSSVTLYAYSMLDKKAFYVYPPQPTSGQGSLDITYAAIPALLTATTDAIPIDEYFGTAIVDYVMFRAMAKDIESQASVAKSQSHYAAFVNSVTSDRAAQPQQGAPQ